MAMTSASTDAHADPKIEHRAPRHRTESPVVWGPDGDGGLARELL